MRLELVLGLMFPVYIVTLWKVNVDSKGNGLDKLLEERHLILFPTVSHKHSLEA